MLPKMGSNTASKGKRRAARTDHTYVITRPYMCTQCDLKLDCLDNRALQGLGHCLRPANTGTVLPIALYSNAWLRLTLGHWGLEPSRT